MSNVPMREMTLNEYIGQLPECHRAYKEYRSLKAEIERKDEALKDAIYFVEELKQIGIDKWSGEYKLKQALQTKEVEG